MPWPIFTQSLKLCRIIDIRRCYSFVFWLKLLSMVFVQNAKTALLKRNSENEIKARKTFIAENKYATVLLYP